MARHGTVMAQTMRHNCRLDRLRAAKMARLGTPYCGELREQNSCQSDCLRPALLASRMQWAVMTTTREQRCSSSLLGRVDVRLVRHRDPQLFSCPVELLKSRIDSSATETL